MEGLTLGLEDVERCKVYDRAAFDLPTFLSMKTSAWILISAGQTMFIPAHLTHKVITPDRYLGLGSFHAGFPGFIDLLRRWIRLPPTWASTSTAPDNRCSVDFATHSAIRKLHSLRTANPSDRNRWGISYLRGRLQQPDVTDDAIDRYSANGDTSNLKAFIQASKRQ